MKQTMIESIADTLKFLARPDVPVSQITLLLGRQRPVGIFGGHALNPHDRRFKTITIRVDPRNSRKLKSIGFHCPEHPVKMSDLIPLVGEFRAKYYRKKKETEFIADGFPEDSIIENFTTRIENYRFVNKRSGGFAVVMPDDSREMVDPKDIFIDHYNFNFIDREPPAEVELKR